MTETERATASATCSGSRDPAHPGRRWSPRRTQQLARADVAHDQEGRRARGETLAQIGTERALAHGVQAAAPQQVSILAERLGLGQRLLEPLRLAASPARLPAPAFSHATLTHESPVRASPRPSVHDP